MKLLKMKRICLVFISLVSFYHLSISQQLVQITLNAGQPPQLQASAGLDIDYAGDSITLGGAPSASGGIIPYSYQWLPEIGLDNPLISNPTFTGSEPVNYILVVKDERGCSASDSIKIIMSGITIIESDNGLIVYPNPVEGIIKLKFSEPIELANLQVSLYNSIGEIVQSTNLLNSEELVLDVTNLIAGNYTLIVGGNAIQISRRIIIKK